MAAPWAEAVPLVGEPAALAARVVPVVLSVVVGEMAAMGAVSVAVEDEVVTVALVAMAAGSKM